MIAGRTPSQTVGPYFAIGLPWSEGPLVVPEGTPGAIWLRGRILDAMGEAVPDALIETWQADARGMYRDPDERGDVAEWFRGFGRASAEPEGEWAILTVKPGATVGRNGRTHAPHIDVSVFARGLLKHLVTRIYFADEVKANAEDPTLASVPDPAARGTLLAARSEDGYRFDIRLQGEGETVFFEV